MSLAVPIVRTRLSLLSNAQIFRLGTGTNVQVHYFRDDTGDRRIRLDETVLHRRNGGGIGDLSLRVKTTLMREGTRALAAGVDVRLPTGDEQNLLGTGAAGVRPFAAFSASYRAFAPHANISYQWNGKSVLAGDVHSDIEADLPDQFHYALGSDLSVTDRFSIVFDVLGERVLDSPRLSTYTLGQRSGRQRRPARHPVRDRSYWVTDGAIGFKANVASRSWWTSTSASTSAERSDRPHRAAAWCRVGLLVTLRRSRFSGSLFPVPCSVFFAPRNSPNSLKFWELGALGGGD